VIPCKQVATKQLVMTILLWIYSFISCLCLLVSF